MIYTHVLNQGGLGVISPLDHLDNLKESRPAYHATFHPPGNPLPALLNVSSNEPASVYAA